MKLVIMNLLILLVISGCSTSPQGFEAKQCQGSCMFYEGYELDYVTEDGCICKMTEERRAKNKKIK